MISKKVKQKIVVVFKKIKIPIKKFKNQGTTNFLTFILAIATVWLGFSTWSSVKSDLGPHVSIKDVKLQLIDETGSIAKDRSWLEGETHNKDASYIKTIEAIVSIKFSNSGRTDGYVELLNHKDLLGIPEGEQNEWLNLAGQTFVPGRGETGWEYNVNIPLNGVSISTYKFAVYDENGKEIERKTVDIFCQFSNIDTGGTNATCKPVNSEIFEDNPK